MQFVGCMVWDRVQYYIAKFPAPKTIQAGTANTSRNCLRKMAIMARYTIMRCKGNPEHERDLLELLPGLHRTMDTDCAAVRMRTTEMWVAAFSVLGSRCVPPVPRPAGDPPVFTTRT